MKKTNLTGNGFAMTLLLTAGLSTVVLAQTPESPTKKGDTRDVNVHIIERNGNEIHEIDRTYRIEGMKDPDRDKLVTKLVDSLRASRKDGQKRQLTITVEDTNGDRIVTRDRVHPDRVGPRSVRPVLPARPMRPTPPGDVYAWRNRSSRTDTSRNWEFEFRRGTDSLASQLKRFSFQFPRDFDRQMVRPFEEWSRNMGGKSSTIRGLDAYPNNPDRNQLNVRFTAPAKGDVRIVVTNPAGKEIARRTLNDFSGEFVGQIDLGKNPTSTYFITVTQNDDGAVKRIVVE
ncbi:MAG: T9SS type A sorting domain-containing protein [Spirosoma sp.]|nr:T9SS type A sorting domain-containing protein [Spirosoma sp.]